MWNGVKFMRQNAVAKYNNTRPKENSKAQIEKKKKLEERYRARICCKKCKSTNTTLYKIKDNNYCINCKDKINKKRKWE